MAPRRVAEPRPRDRDKYIGAPGTPEPQLLERGRLK